VEKIAQKLWATSVILKILPKVNNRPLGETSPHLVTLVTYATPFAIIYVETFFQISSFSAKKIFASKTLSMQRLRVTTSFE
jgi:hypothetical protein